MPETGLSSTSRLPASSLRLHYKPRLLPPHPCPPFPTSIPSAPFRHPACFSVILPLTIAAPQQHLPTSPHCYACRPSHGLASFSVHGLFVEDILACLYEARRLRTAAGVYA
ncbi:hypothetical protein FB45DRAFT_1005238 [Roridomyces roridus]|uniref:Uncharacterized protein n=1 Tax=Roridomyces roridus TaxID=1738132 RepID=A0AAD7FLP3_9AGAR|nr:hypothetical protein FB45DRAFT_1005238 [Roridomyces roridus]